MLFNIAPHLLDQVVDELNNFDLNQTQKAAYYLALNKPEIILKSFARSLIDLMYHIGMDFDLDEGDYPAAHQALEKNLKTLILSPLSENHFIEGYFTCSIINLPKTFGFHMKDRFKDFLIKLNYTYNSNLTGQVQLLPGSPIELLVLRLLYYYQKNNPDKKIIKIYGNDSEDQLIFNNAFRLDLDQIKVSKILFSQEGILKNS